MPEVRYFPLMPSTRSNEYRLQTSNDLQLGTPRCLAYRTLKHHRISSSSVTILEKLGMILWIRKDRHYNYRVTPDLHQFERSSKAVSTSFPKAHQGQLDPWGEA